jgi:hypothetical protein
MRTESREQRAENREQRTESREQRSIGLTTERGQEERAIIIRANKVI